ncbi:MAG: hypothetical protein IKU98_06430 [Bacteroidaceae bacterium]|nr:hypothetical protein [Bacteroidaceae bacterium]
MKKIYLYVPDGDSMAYDSVVVWLSVGTSKADRTKLALLECYANDLGQFLRVRDDDTNFWLDQRAKELFPDSNCPRMHFYSGSLPIGEAYKLIIDGQLDLYVRNLPKPTHYLNTLFHLDANFMRSHSPESCITSCPRGKRKYLSQTEVSQLVYATLPITLFILCGVVDWLGERIINFLF